MTESILDYCCIRKDYYEVRAVDDVNLQIPRGEIYGLIGPNGAGKTTLLRMAATTLEPTRGKVLFNGRDVWEDPLEVRLRIGFMGDFFQVYRDLKVREFLEYFAIAHGMDRKLRIRRVQEVLEEIGLTGKGEEFCKGLSRGMVQRLGLGRAILHEPELLLLDEPASGLDPSARKRLFDILHRSREKGATVLISSHILSELSEICDSVCMMNHGRVMHSGPTRSVIESLLPNRPIHVRVLPGRAETARGLLEGLPNVKGIETDDVTVKFTFEGGDAALAGLLEAMVNGGAGVVNFQESPTSLHEAYFTLSAEEN
jgi:ABC-2 type transport system ATP-binding protein